MANIQKRCGKITAPFRKKYIRRVSVVERNELVAFAAAGAADSADGFVCEEIADRAVKVSPQIG